MNGRCETDPLDRAVDVCDSCYGEFCKVCLVLPKGRRHPICTHCTLVLSGVRGHATVQPRGDKRTVKQRRVELQAAATQPSDDQVFRFFDADTQPDGADAAEAGRRSGRRPTRKDRRAKSDPATPPAPRPTPSAAPLPMPAEVAAAAAELMAAASGQTGVAAPTETSNGGEGADPTELVTVTRAVARLEELRRQGASPTTSPVPEVPAAVPAAAVGDDDETEAEPPVDAELPAEADEPAADAGPPPRRPGPPPKPRAAEPTPRPDRRRPQGADRDGRPPTAPMVGEVRTIGGRRSSDQAPAPQPARTRPAAAPVPAHAGATAIPERPLSEAEADGTEMIDDDELVSVSEALSGVDRFDARQPGPAPAAAASGESRKADTDSQGNWIPPILRGMAPDAREAKTNLPKRKRGS